MHTPKPFRELVAGDAVDAIVAVLKAELQEKKDGEKYFKLSVSDANGHSMTAKVWGVQDAHVPRIKKVLWARITGRVKSFDGNLEINHNGPFDDVAEPENASDYIPASAIPLTELRNRLRAYIHSIQQPQLQALLKAVFVKDATLAEPFELFPAADIRHHAFRHGLIQHSLEVADIVDAVCERHRNWGSGRGRLSRDLAVTGALIHDIGKLEEYELKGHGVRFSTSGSLLGHVTLGVVRLARKIAHVRKHLEFDEKLEEIVLHLVVAHHGKSEYGAPVLPKIAEAALIHYADMISAECFYFAEADTNVTEGDHEWIQWKLDKRRLYVAPLDSIWGETPSESVVSSTAQLGWSSGAAPSVVSESNHTPYSVTATALPVLRLSPHGENNFATVRLSLSGRIAAGTPIEATLAEDDVFIEAEGLRIKGADCFTLRVVGDSMIGDGIYDGDIIVVRQQVEADYGDIVVAAVHGEGATVKHLAFNEGRICLESSNPDHPPIYIQNPESLRIQGKVIAVAR